jgi:hypothetical protein
MSDRPILIRRALLPLASVAMILASGPAHAADLPDFKVIRIDTPATMTVGLSATFTIIIGNIGTASGPVEVDVEFSGVLDQTDQVLTDNGLGCAISHDEDFGVNTVLHCSGATLEPQRSLTIVVQGRAQAAGEGSLNALIINYGGLATELDFSNNTYGRAIQVN